MKICICDDDILIHDQIKNYLNNSVTSDMRFDINDVYSGEALLQSYTENSFDIIFVDVEMGDLNGIETVRKIREIDSKVIVIFVSSYSKYVFEVFPLETLHFIMKPILQEEFSEVFNRALNKYRTRNSSITFKWQKERLNLMIADIMYIEGYKRHLTVYTKDSQFESVGKIPDIFKVLEPHGFIRVHQGFIVNMDYIKRIETTDLILKDDRKVMISVRKRTDVVRAYDEYIRKRKW